MSTPFGAIHRELRLAAILGLLIMRPALFWFRLLAKVSRLAAGRNIAGLDCGEIHIARRSGGGSIRTRIYRPKAADAKLPVLLYLHGGGYFFGTPEAFAPMIERFIATRPCIVVSPDYRKSFDAPYPAAIDDCYDTLLWIRDHIAEYGGDPQRILAGGHSAGGGLTAALSLRARDRGEVKIAYQMPIYPMIDDRMQHPSAIGNTAPWWNSKTNALGWQLYLADLHRSGAQIPSDAAPARATDYRNLPPTMTLVGELDPFRDETIAYVEHLQSAGVPVSFKRYDGCFHAFDMVASSSEPGADALKFTLDCFATALDHLEPYASG